MHAYNALNLVMWSQHLELYKELCVFMMECSYSFPPYNDKSYQSFPAPKAMENNQDLIIWPPLVIIHNACTIKIKDGHLEGIGNREMEEQLKGVQSNSILFLFWFPFPFQFMIIYDSLHSVHGSYPTIWSHFTIDMTWIVLSFIIKRWL